MATCSTCRAQYTRGEHPCPRCGQDNSFWEEQRELTRWNRVNGFFANIWGIVAVAIALVALVLLIWTIVESIAWSFPNVEAGLTTYRLRIMGQFLALFMSFISIFVIYVMRFRFWNYSWIRRVTRRTLPDLYTIAVILFLLGVLLLLAYLTASIFIPGSLIQSNAGTAGQNWLVVLFNRIVMPAMYGFLFAFFTTGSMLMSAGLFVDRMNERGGQPIFMNTPLLADVVKGEIAGTLELSVEALRLSSIKRTEYGGINMLVIYSPTDQATSSGEPERKEKRFTVEANKWGQLNSLIEESKPSHSR